MFRRHSCRLREGLYQNLKLTEIQFELYYGIHAASVNMWVSSLVIKMV
jgi:hypothetical protein